jgi:hypothetical protein
MEWLIVGLLIGFAIGRVRKRPDIDLAANRLQTRCNMGVRIADESKALSVTVAEQARNGQIDPKVLARLMNSVADLNYLASDMIDDHVALLTEVANGRT